MEPVCYKIKERIESFAFKMTTGRFGHKSMVIVFRPG